MEDNKVFETKTEERLYKKALKKKKRKNKLKQNLKKIIIFILIIFLIKILISAFAGGTGKRKNILLLGTDEGGLRADVIMIVSVSRGEINLISVPRDTRIKNSSGYMKINSALSVGGDDYLIEKVEEVTGIEIHEYIKVDFEAVENVIDAFGGVDFNIPQDMDYEDPYQDLYIHFKKGETHLNGEDSLKLLRYRGYAMADIERTSVQREFIKEFLSQNFNAFLIFKLPRAGFEFARGADTSLNPFETGVNVIRALSGKKNINTLEVPYYFSPSGTYVLINDEKMSEIAENYFK